MSIETVLVTGGAGYVGSVLVPKLLAQGYKVKVLDLYVFGDDVLSEVADNPNLEQIKGDMRSRSLLETSLVGVDAVIHLACISNDPSFELDPSDSRAMPLIVLAGLKALAIVVCQSGFRYGAARAATRFTALGSRRHR